MPWTRSDTITQAGYALMMNDDDKKDYDDDDDAISSLRHVAMEGTGGSCATDCFFLPQKI